MIVGVAAKVVPTLNGIDVHRLGGLWVPYVLLLSGCTLRVFGQTATDFTPSAFPVTGVSGLLELSGLAIWGVHLLRLMTRRDSVTHQSPRETTRQATELPITADANVGAVLRDYPRLLDTFVAFGFTPLAMPCYAIRSHVEPRLARRQGCSTSIFRTCSGPSTESAEHAWRPLHRMARPTKPHNCPSFRHIHEVCDVLFLSTFSDATRFLYAGESGLRARAARAACCGITRSSRSRQKSAYGRRRKRNGLGTKRTEPIRSRLQSLCQCTRTYVDRPARSRAAVHRSRLSRFRNRPQSRRGPPRPATRLSRNDWRRHTKRGAGTRTDRTIRGSRDYRPTPPFRHDDPGASSPTIAASARRGSVSVSNTHQRLRCGRCARRRWRRRTSWRELGRPSPAMARLPRREGH